LCWGWGVSHRSIESEQPCNTKVYGCFNASTIQIRKTRKQHKCIIAVQCARYIDRANLMIVTCCMCYKSACEHLQECYHKGHCSVFALPAKDFNVVLHGNCEEPKEQGNCNKRTVIPTELPVSCQKGTVTGNMLHKY
jgi:hypothetical protein